jgi:mannose-6-phosphate isomerase-like protein (cupin superfamily)
MTTTQLGRKIISSGLFCVIAVCLLVGVSRVFAQAPSQPYVFVSSASLNALEQKLISLLKTADKTKAVNEPLSPELVKFNPDHRAIMFHRDAASPGEIHERFSDFAIVRSGSGSVLIGGKILNPKVDSPGEIRGNGVEGGTKIRFGPGDVLYVPANVPHQFVPDPGKPYSILVFKPVGIAPRDHPAEFVLWTAAQLDAMDKELVTKLDATKGANVSLATNGGSNEAMDNRRALVFHRDGSGPAEIHEKISEFAYVRKGSGALMLGGKLDDAKSQGGAEIRGSAIQGGNQIKISAEEIVYIPANVPHRFIVEPGQSLNVIVFKLR